VQLSNRELGNIGEDIATQFLQDLGYQILDRNFRSGRTEIDIIASNSRTLVFCEVKTRRSRSHGFPSEAITAIKLEHIRSAALGWLACHKVRYIGIRFDAVSVFYSSKSNYEITHLKGIE
jgi:putative endonuclease